MTKTREELTADVVAAKAANRADNTQATRDAYRAAWNALADIAPPVTGGGRGCRAGQRQHAERRAEYQERVLRAARRAK